MHTSISSPASACPVCSGALRAGVCPVCLLSSALCEEIEPPPEETPLQVGDYDLLEKIAEGGMGVVWRARQRRFGRIVALKLLRESCLPGEASARRFRIEAEAVALLHHPHIVTVHEVGETGGRYFLSMELLGGGSLADRLRTGAFPARAAAELLAKVARGIQHAHERGVLHRDLKPGNVLLDEDGAPRVTDFGLARLVEEKEHMTVSGAIMGTPAYMSPEQATGLHGEATTASDTYSLGAILYELLTGTVPFHADNQLELLRRVAEDAPASPSAIVPGLDRDLETICLKCLEKAPAARYRSALALAEDLERWLRGEPIQARPIRGLERLWKWSRRHKTLAALYVTGLAAFVAITAGTIVFTARLREEVRRTQAAERSTRLRLAYQHSDAAGRFMAAGDWLRALPHLVENLTLTGGDPIAERLGRMRFEATVRLAPSLDALWLPGEQLRGVDFDEDANRVAIFAGSTARVFDAATGEALAPPLEHPSRLRHGFLAEGGTRLLCQTDDHGWTLWELPGGRPLASHAGDVFSMGTATGINRPHTHYFSSDIGPRIELYSLADGEPRAAPDFQGELLWSVYSASDLFIATTDGRLRVHRATSTDPVAPPLALGRDFSLGGVDADLRTAAFTTDTSEAGLRLVQVEIATGRIVGEGRAASRTTPIHGWSGEQWLTLTRTDEGMVLRDALTDAILSHARHAAQGIGGAFASERGRFATTARDGSVRVWSKRGDALTPLLWTGGMPEHIRLSRQGERLLMSGNLPDVRLWTLREDDGAWCVGTAPVTGLRFASDSRLLVTRRDGRAEQWDLATRTQLGEPPSPPPPAADQPLAFSPDRHTLAAWAGPGPEETLRTVRVTDATTGTPRYPALVHDNDVTGAAFSPDGRLIATTGRDAVRLWDAATGAPIRVFRDHPLPPQSAGFSPDGAMVWSRTTKEIRVWETATGILCLPPLVVRGKGAVAWSPDGCWLAALDDKLGFRAWNLTPGTRPLPELRALAHRLSGHGICPDGEAYPLPKSDQGVPKERGRPGPVVNGGSAALLFSTGAGRPRSLDVAP